MNEDEETAIANFDDHEAELQPGIGERKDDAILTLATRTTKPQSWGGR